MKPLTAKERKERPVYSGVLRYFPLALLEIARVSQVGHDQHNDGPMRWDRSKSPDEADALVRHLLQAGEIDTDGLRHSAKVAWRAMALLEKELEAAGAVSGAQETEAARTARTEMDRRAPDPRTKPAHDELYALGQPCAGGCGWLTHPEGMCRKCRSMVP
jgi:hypothetical protein